jgi:hypothetical protein
MHEARGFRFIKAAKDKRKKVVPIPKGILPNGHSFIFLFSFAAFMNTKKDNNERSPKQGGDRLSGRIS